MAAGSNQRERGGVAHGTGRHAPPTSSTGYGLTGRPATNGSPPTTKTGTEPRPCRPRCGAAGRSGQSAYPTCSSPQSPNKNASPSLHYDSDYDPITQVTRQPTQWVVPRGTIP